MESHWQYCSVVPCPARSLYVRTFGATNHEVKTTTDGQLETIRPVQGRFYRFNLCQPCGHALNVLVITEIDATQPACGTLELQLLDPGDTDACPGWGEELPARLRQMHSHWFDRCVTDLRPCLFDARQASISMAHGRIKATAQQSRGGACSSIASTTSGGSRDDRVCCVAYVLDSLISCQLTSFSCSYYQSRRRPLTD